MRSFFWVFPLLILFSSCGYHLETPLCTTGRTTVHIPYVAGDLEGKFTDALIQAVNISGFFEYVDHSAHYTLQAKVVRAGDERIGFRYDRSPVTERLRNNLMAVESRRSLAVEIELIDNYTGRMVLGPEIVTADVDYDYVDSNSLKDLAFVTPDGQRRPVISFSLGELDSKEGAILDAQFLLYKQISKKIVDGIAAYECNGRKAKSE